MSQLPRAETELRPSWARISVWILTASLPAVALLVWYLPSMVALPGMTGVALPLLILATCLPFIVGPFVYRTRTKLTQHRGAVELHQWTGRVHRFVIADGDLLQVRPDRRYASFVDASGGTKLRFWCWAFRRAELHEWCQANGLGYRER